MSNQALQSTSTPPLRSDGAAALVRRYPARECPFYGISLAPIVDPNLTASRVLRSLVVPLSSDSVWQVPACQHLRISLV
jgi:hypothetical protein